ncbi:MAG: methionyl-tRNA formyltransferase [Bacillota bacterium]
MRLVFMGTPEFAVQSLDKLHQAGHEILGVITQPDRPKGRGQKLTPSPVKVRALELNLEVYQPLKIKEPDFIGILKELNPEVIIVVAYGQILSKAILDMPVWGCINVHASLLPKYRGAAPIHWAVINGESETGITTMKMDEGLDTGDILLKARIEIGPDTTTGELHDCLAELGGKVLIETLDLLEKGEISPQPQDNQWATYAPLLTKSHEEIKWKEDSIKIHNLVRGMNPWPGAYTCLGENRIKIRETRISQDPGKKIKGLPGEILEFLDAGFLVQTGGSSLLVTKVQPAGKNIITANDFVNGYGIIKGQTLGGCYD